MKNNRAGKLLAAVFLICLFLSAPPASALLTELNVDPFNLDLGSRPLGMGAAYTGLVDDVNAALYNPAGLAWVKGVSLSLRDIENLSAVQAYPTGYGSSLGLAVISRKISNIPITGGVASARSNVVVLSYGTKLNFLPNLYKDPLFQRIGVGVNIKGLAGETLNRTGLDDRSATGWDADLGVLWKVKDWWSLGLSLQNILPAGSFGGGQIKWDVGTPESFTEITRIAAAARVIGDIGSPVFMEGRELIIAGEMDFYAGQPTLIRLGGEWNLEKQFYIRSGFMQQQSRGGITSDINFGMGFRWERFGLDFASYREPVRDERTYYISALYFPRDWIVVPQLEVAKPAVMLEEPFERISLADNIVTYDESLDVFGRVKSGVEVYVNGLRVEVDEHNDFRVVVPLNLEKNLILVEARYEGEKKTWKYKVLRKVKVKVAEEAGIKAEISKAVVPAEKEKLIAEERRIEQKKEQVEALVTIGVIEVTPEAEFVMEAGVTRGELATWIVRGADLKLPEVNKDLFVDVPKDHPLAPYIKIVTDFDLIKPFPDGTFRPGDFVTKEEGEAIFARFGVKQ